MGMLEAVMESDEDVMSKHGSTSSDQDEKEDTAPINGLEAEDRRTVKNLVNSIRGRLTIIRRKLQVIQKRASAPSISSPSRASPPVSTRDSNPPAALITPPRS